MYKKRFNVKALLKALVTVFVPTTYVSLIVFSDVYGLYTLQTVLLSIFVIGALILFIYMLYFLFDN